MYTEPSGLGQLTKATAYVTGGGGSTHPCSDFMFKMMNRSNCAAAGYNGAPKKAPEPIKKKKAAPPPVEERIVYAPGPTDAGGGGAPPVPIIQTFDVGDQAGGGGGGGPSTTIFELIPGDPSTLFAGPADVSIDVDAPSRGFGLVEAAIAAGLGYLLYRAYQ